MKTSEGESRETFQIETNIVVILLLLLSNGDDNDVSLKLPYHVLN